MIDAVVDEVLKEMGNAANEGIMAVVDEVLKQGF